MEIYLDNSATTRCYPSAARRMYELMTEEYGNPSSLHHKGVEAEEALREAKKILARSLKVQEKELYFTSGGTESDNLALIGGASANQRAGKHLITTAVEHPAVLQSMRYLENQGFRVTHLPVDSAGVVRLQDLQEALCDETILVSVMYVNNEVGALQPVEEIGALLKNREKPVLFHVDAVQAYGKYQIHPGKLGIDLLSVSSHKIHGPKGMGLLYVREGVKVRPLLYGGGQQKDLRPGTENVPGIIGFAAAVKRAMRTMEARTAKERELREYLIGRVLLEVPYTRLNGHRTNRLPNNANFSFQFIEGESLLIMLDTDGICGSSGSACTSGSLDPSHVLLAIGLPHEIAHGSLRLTLSEETTKEELDYVVESIKKIVERLRSMSPLYEDFMRRQ